MADIEYPCNLPGVLVNSNGYTPRLLVDTNPMDSGPPVFRLHASDGWLAFDVAWSYSALEKQVFTAWHRSILARGSKTFNIELWIDGFDGVKNTVTHRANFSSSPQYTQAGKRWRVSATIMAIEYAGLDDCDSESLVSAFNGFESVTAGINGIAAAIEEIELLWLP